MCLMICENDSSHLVILCDLSDKLLTLELEQQVDNYYLLDLLYLLIYHYFFYTVTIQNVNCSREETDRF